MQGMIMIATGVKTTQKMMIPTTMGSMMKMEMVIPLINVLKVI
jgi:hypothetical protein